MGRSFLHGQSVESIFSLSNSTDGQPGKSVPSRWSHVNAPINFQTAWPGCYFGSRH